MLRFRLFLPILFMLLTLSAAAHEWEGQKGQSLSIEKPYKSYAQWMTYSEMQRTPRSYYLDFSKRPKWSYVMGIELEAMLDTYLRYGDQKILDYCRLYTDTMINDAGDIKGYNILDYNLDNVRTGHFVTRMYQQQPEAKNLKAMQTLMKQLQDQPRTKADKVYWHKAIYAYQVWLDGIFMGLPYRCLTASVVDPKGAKNIYDDAVNQLNITYQRTLDPKTGLNRHAYDENRNMFWADKNTGLSQHCWGRAQGWFTMALIEVLDALPENYERRGEVIELLKKDLDAVIKWQDKKSGVWYQVMDSPQREGNYLESTCSAMFAYSLLKAARKGYVGNKYREAGIRAYKGILDNFIRVNADNTISLTQCCSVAGLGPGISPEVEAALKKISPKAKAKEDRRRDGSYEYYLSESIRDNDAKGVGPFIWASLEMDMLHAPAFPGAEGHGRYVTGGRGGEVRHVTTLLDDGKTTTKGTLRWAVSGDAPKTVVFDVGGIIELTKDLDIGLNTTIAGQTAPAPGITIRYYTVHPNTNNIIRFIRIRRGEEKNINDGADAICLRGADGIILDHCSFSWSIDEIASFYDNTHFTMQWCTIGEALANPGHSKGEHSYGGIWGGKGASFHHNFLCHMQNRSPRFCGARYDWESYDKTKYGSTIEAEIVDFRNCVIYNWGNGSGCYGGTGGGNINIVNNYYKAGPGTANKTRVTQVSVANSGNANGSSFMGYCSRYYINGNYVTAAGTKAANYDWSGVIHDKGVYTINGSRYCADPNHLYGPNAAYVKNSDNVDCVKIKLDSPVDAGEVTTHTAQDAYMKVLEYAGASLCRDAVDARYMDEARNGTTHYIGSATTTGDGKNIKHYKGIIDFVRDQGTYTLESTARPKNFDTDGDGMPDEWETANGLNPDNAADGNTITLDIAKGWYTNLEVYLSSLVEDIMKDGNADAIESVDEYYPANIRK